MGQVSWEVNKALHGCLGDTRPVLPGLLPGIENTLTCLLPTYLGLKINNPHVDFVLVGRNLLFKQRTIDGSVVTYCLDSPRYQI